MVIKDSTAVKHKGFPTYAGQL